MTPPHYHYNSSQKNKEKMLIIKWIVNSTGLELNTFETDEFNLMRCQLGLEGLCAHLFIVVISYMYGMDVNHNLFVICFLAK